tara:strand:+ start:160 stop:480 length:321 start_codon:yes stop_codon:yes gene_type:complete
MKSTGTTAAAEPITIDNRAGNIKNIANEINNLIFIPLTFLVNPINVRYKNMNNVSTTPITTPITPPIMEDEESSTSSTGVSVSVLSAILYIYKDFIYFIKYVIIRI